STGLLGALLAVTIIVAIGSLAIPAERRALFGTSAKDCNADSANCIVGRNAYWLGSQWWHPLLAVGTLLAILIIVPLLVRGVNRGRSSRMKRSQARKARDEAAGDDDATGKAMPTMSVYRASDKT